ncbi:MAG TPA: phosphomannomutase/phosphoglucomutase [Candidatus Peregrinibacteria bacterium]|nr:phosphomannomutase/phosphoglucomutase [Candidatus Peregrinibacteria bacterium]
MNINPHIFRAYDIRGVYGEDFTVEAAELIGKGVGSYLKLQKAKGKMQNENLKLVVGRDNRVHGEELQKAFIRGILSTGCDVVDIGLAISPMLYFAVCEGNFDGGVSITASHNPAEYNGFKLVGEGAHSICGEEIQKIQKIIEKMEFKEGEGNLEEGNFTDQYYEKIKGIIRLERPLKVVVDTANGVAGLFYPELFRQLGCEVVELFSEQDGTFPSHEPDPIVEENLGALKKKITEEKADLGIAFDGDGDRVGIVDEKGVYHDANKILILLAKDLLSRNSGAKVVYTVSNSSIIASEVEKAGGRALMTPVGHSFVEIVMKKEGALLGGEQSGHFFVEENYFSFDDASYAAAKVLEILAKSGKSFSELMAEIPEVYSEPEKRPFCSDETKFDVVEKISEEFSKKYPCNTIDGVRVDFGDDAWAGIRASNTSPCLSVITEAKSSEKLAEVNKITWEVLQKYGIKA